MSVAVVIPVRDAGMLLDRCLDSVLAETVAAGAELVVVDDASSDGSAATAERLGARVLRHAAPQGPYAARNTGWRATRAATLVFTDVRSRPRPGWLAGLAEALASPSVAIAGGDVRAVGGRRVAQRYVERWQPLMPERGLGHEFLPFVATANLATHRDVLETVGGFDEIRSGGDLDFCWRVQLAGLGRVVRAEHAAVDWEPRESVREVVGQWRRYGAAKPTLWARYVAHGLVAEPPPAAAGLWLRELRALQWRLRRARPGDWPLEVVDRLCQLAYWSGYRAAYARGPHP